MLATHAITFCYYSVDISFISTKPQKVWDLMFRQSTYLFLEAVYPVGMTRHWYHFR